MILISAPFPKKSKGANRSLTMSKKELVSRGHDLPPIKLKPKTQQYINGLLSHQPLMEREKNDLIPRTERGSQADGSSFSFWNTLSLTLLNNCFLCSNYSISKRKPEVII